jgi:D-sedoheptulose 7-phosphate isomerase
VNRTGKHVSPALRSLREHLETIERLADECLPTIQDAANLINAALRSGKKLLLCGNGGSAADAQHIAAEFAGRFEAERRPYPALALTTDTSKLTAIGNDYGFEKVFQRQVESLATSGDVLVAISTSGESANVIAAVEAARQRGCLTIALTGANGKKLAAVCDVAIVVPSVRTCRIQEAHITVAHLLCELADIALAEP